MKRYQNFGLLTKKKASKFRCFLFLCERECMRYRVRKPRFAPLHIATAPLFTLHILVIPFVAFRSLYTNLPNAEAIHLIRILGWILNHLFRCWTLRYACKHARSRSYTNPPLSKKSRCLFLYRKNRPFGRFLFWFWVKLITLRSRRF